MWYKIEMLCPTKNPSKTFFFTFGDKLEMSFIQPSHLIKNLASVNVAMSKKTSLMPLTSAHSERRFENDAKEGSPTLCERHDWNDERQKRCRHSPSWNYSGFSVIKL